MKLQLCLLSLFFVLSSSFGAEIRGRVVKVSDGDTVTVLDAEKTQHKIRLLGIDAPEKKQPFGTVSKDSLGALVHEKDVVVDYKTRDRYGRVVGKVIYNGEDINLKQVQAGLAWHYKDYVKSQPKEDRALYAEAETKARSEKVGLWSQEPITAPWEFRKSKALARKQK